MASSRVAGLPSMVATGRSSTWWLRNHALPRTQAFLALVMWLFSTVSSMSSQTQPQKVQVALLTTFSSVPLPLIDQVSVGGGTPRCSHSRLVNIELIFRCQGRETFFRLSVVL